jgi:hypothetical protein
MFPLWVIRWSFGSGEEGLSPQRMDEHPSLGHLFAFLRNLKSSPCKQIPPFPRRLMFILWQVSIYLLAASRCFEICTRVCLSAMLIWSRFNLHLSSLNCLRSHTKKLIYRVCRLLARTHVHTRVHALFSFCLLNPGNMFLHTADEVIYKPELTPLSWALLVKPPIMSYSRISQHSILCNSKIHCHVHKSHPLVPILSQIHGT